MTEVLYTNVCKIGNKIAFRGINLDTNERVQGKQEFYPTLYLPSQKETEYTTLDGSYLEPIKPGLMYECYQFFSQYADVEGMDVYGNDNYVVQWIADAYKNLDLEEISGRGLEKVKTLLFDIENETENGFSSPQRADEKINVITAFMEDTYHVFALGDFSTDRNDCEVLTFTTEEELLEAFIYFWKQEDPDVVTGWNIDTYDIPYTINRIEKVLGEGRSKDFSPWRKIKEKEITYYGKPQQTYLIEGVAVLDYLRLYKKYRLIPRESHKLDFIGDVELGMRKLDWQEEYETMKEFYTKDFQKFVDYNIRDVEIVVKLNKKLQLIRLITNIAYLAGINYEDVFSQVRTWDSIIYNHLRKKNVVVPPKKTKGKSSQFAGAYVKDPNVGYHKWIVSFDANSLYPSVIRQLNISPEKLITPQKLRNIRTEENGEDVDLLLNLSDARIPLQMEDMLDAVDNEYMQAARRMNFSVAGNGHMYSNVGDGFLPELMDKFYNERKVSKKNMLGCYDDIEKIKAELKSRGHDIH